MSGASSVTVTGGTPLRGRVHVPGDKSISHRALLIGARAEGTSTVSGCSDGADVAHTARAVEALGARIEGELGTDAFRITGGCERLREARCVIDVGNSGTGIRLLAGFVAGFEWHTVLDGDDSVRGRPMDRVATPLRLMGAHIDGRNGGRLAPLAIRGGVPGGGPLHGVDYSPPVPSAQVKSAVLLAGLGAEGATVVREPVPTRRHTEELLALAGADIESSGDQMSSGVDEAPSAAAPAPRAGRPGPAAGGEYAVRVRPGPLAPFELEVPGDPSQAAFFLVAACLVEGSEVVCERIYVGPGRAAYLDVLARMGALVEIEHRDATTADVVARHRQEGRLQAVEVGGDDVAALIDEVPVLAVAAAFAEGTSTFRGLGELRVKESDRLATVTEALRRVGVSVEQPGDDLVVEGGPVTEGGVVDSHGDHRIAMAMAVCGLASSGGVTIEGWDSVATSYPGFLRDLDLLRGGTAITGGAAR